MIDILDTKTLNIGRKRLTFTVFSIEKCRMSIAIPQDRNWLFSTTPDPNRTGPGGAACPAAARQRRAEAGLAAPPGPVRFGPPVSPTE